MGLLILAVLLAAVVLLIFLIVRMSRSSRESEARIDELTGSVEEIRDRVRSREEADVDALRFGVFGSQKTVVHIDDRVSRIRDVSRGSSQRAGYNGTSREGRGNAADDRDSGEPVSAEDVAAQIQKLVADAARSVSGAQVQSAESGAAVKQGSGQRTKTPDKAAGTGQNAQTKGRNAGTVQSATGMPGQPAATGSAAKPGTVQHAQVYSASPDAMRTHPVNGDSEAQAGLTEGYASGAGDAPGEQSVYGTGYAGRRGGSYGLSPSGEPVYPSLTQIWDSGSSGGESAVVKAGRPARTGNRPVMSGYSGGRGENVRAASERLQENLSTGKETGRMTGYDRENEGISRADAESRLLALRRRAEEDAMSRSPDNPGEAAGQKMPVRNNMWGDVYFPKDLLGNLEPVERKPEKKVYAPMGSPFGAQTFSGSPGGQETMLGDISRMKKPVSGAASADTAKGIKTSERPSPGGTVNSGKTNISGSPSVSDKPARYSEKSGSLKSVNNGGSVSGKSGGTIKGAVSSAPPVSPQPADTGDIYVTDDNYVEELARQKAESQAMPGVEENRMPSEKAQQEIDRAIDGPSENKAGTSAMKYDARDSGVDKHGNIYTIDDLRKQIQ